MKKFPNILILSQNRQNHQPTHIHNQPTRLTGQFTKNNSENQLTLFLKFHKIHYRTLIRTLTTASFKESKFRFSDN